MNKDIILKVLKQNKGEFYLLDVWRVQLMKHKISLSNRKVGNIFRALQATGYKIEKKSIKKYNANWVMYKYGGV